MNITESLKQKSIHMYMYRISRNQPYTVGCMNSTHELFESGVGWLDVRQRKFITIDRLQGIWEHVLTNWY